MCEAGFGHDLISERLYKRVEIVLEKTNARYNSISQLPHLDVTFKRGADDSKHAYYRALEVGGEVYLIKEILGPVMKRSLYRLSCAFNSCSWQMMRQDMDAVNFAGSMMVLPSGYSCQSKSFLPFNLFVVNGRRIY